MTKLSKREKREQLLRRIIEEATEALAVNDDGAEADGVPEGYLPRKYACEVLGVRKTRLDTLVDKGRVRRIQRGWRVYYATADVVEEAIRRRGSGK